MNETDLLLVNRNGRDYALPATEFEALADDADLLVVNRDGVDYKVTAEDLKEYIYPEEENNLDPDGDELGNNILAVFEVISPMAFSDCNDSWDQTKRVTYWYNGKRYKGFPCHFHNTHSVRPGDVFAVKLPPSMYDIRTYNMGEKANINLELTKGKIHFLPETNIRYMTDETLEEWTSYKGNNKPWLLCGMWNYRPEECPVTGFENIKLNPDLSNNNPEWHLFGMGGGELQVNLKDCMHKGEPAEKPDFPTSELTDHPDNDILNQATYGLIANNYYMSGANVEMPIWRVYVGEKYDFDDYRKYQGIWHIENVTDPISLNKTVTAWNIDGSNKREIDEIAIGEEVVICSTSNASDLFKNNQGSWDFGRLTNTEAVNNMSGMFLGCTNFNGKFGGDFSTGSVTDFSSMFEDTHEFNQDISGWKIYRTDTDMSRMFKGSKAFNWTLEKWRSSKMSEMFADSNFNNEPPGFFSDGDYSYMFHNATEFQQDISWYRTFGEDANLAHMFDGASKFNCDLKCMDRKTGWNVEDLSKPTGFDTGTTSWTLPKPAWGQPCGVS